MSEVLERRGHRVHLAPLLHVNPLPFDGRVLRTASAIILTSANAVPALEGLDPTIRVFAVGPDTASPARAAGLSNIAAASGTAGSLLEMVRHRWRPEYGPLAYPSGRHVSFDVAGALAAQGYSCARVGGQRAKHQAEMLDLLRCRLLAPDTVPLQAECGERRGLEPDQLTALAPRRASLSRPH